MEERHHRGQEPATTDAWNHPCGQDTRAEQRMNDKKNHFIPEKKISVTPSSDSNQGHSLDKSRLQYRYDYAEPLGVRKGILILYTVYGLTYWCVSCTISNKP